MLPSFRSTTLCLLLGCTTLLASPAHASSKQDAELDKLLGLDLEQLAGLDYEVTSVSKRRETILNATSAIYVITQEDIHRSGMQEIPELLRMVPGMNVARINASTWSISARGFGKQFGNKLLVLIDGRSVYNQSFSGVYWDEQDLLLEDVERIEVVRGPGATLYGANAVNGVVNIITKAASETQGNYVSVGAGNYLQGAVSMRHGGKLDQGHYRVYAKGRRFNDSEPLSGSTHEFDWEDYRSGFRADWSADANDHFTLQGDVFKLRDQLVVDNYSFAAPYHFQAKDIHHPFGGNLLGRWTHQQSEDSEWQVTGYLDHTDRQESYFTVRNTTLNLEAQQIYTGFENQVLVWGLGGRLIDGALPGSTPFIGATPPETDSHLVNFFVQDEFALIPDRWMLTLGAKLEHNSFTGFEVQPSIRSLWKLDDRQSIWGAISQAARTPSYVEDHFTYTLAMAPGTPGIPFNLYGNSDLDAERLTAYELGYRAAFNDNANVDVSLFYNDYEHIIGQEVILGGAALMFDNDYHGETYGFEIAPNWQVTPNWKLRASYSFLEMALHSDVGSFPVAAASEEGQSPQQQFSLMSYWTLPNHFQLDTMLFYVDELPNYGIEGYVRADMRLGWQASENLEFSLVGQNLLDDSHLEFASQAPQGAQLTVPRSIFAQMTWRF